MKQKFSEFSRDRQRKLCVSRKENRKLRWIIRHVMRYSPVKFLSPTDRESVRPALKNTDKTVEHFFHECFFFLPFFFTSCYIINSVNSMWVVNIIHILCTHIILQVLHSSRNKYISFYVRVFFHHENHIIRYWLYIVCGYHSRVEKNNNTESLFW